MGKDTPCLARFALTTRDGEAADHVFLLSFPSNVSESRRRKILLLIVFRDHHAMLDARILVQGNGHDAWKSNPKWVLQIPYIPLSLCPYQTIVAMSFSHLNHSRNSYCNGFTGAFSTRTTRARVRSVLITRVTLCISHRSRHHTEFGQHPSDVHDGYHKNMMASTNYNPID